MKIVVITVLCFSFPALGVTQETQRFAFVSEYVRELGVNENLRELNLKEIADKKNDNELCAAGIRGTTRIILELNAQIQILNVIHLNRPFDKLPTSIVEFYSQKIDLYDALVSMCTMLLAGPKAGVDYGRIRASAPKIATSIEYIDRALLEATPLIFSTLIDDMPDEKGRTNRLIITKAQRDQLARSLMTSFGDKLEQHYQGFFASGATVLRDHLLKKGYKCSDELKGAN